VRPVEVVLVDAGGVLVLPDRDVVSVALGPGPWRETPEVLDLAHYRAIAAVDEVRPASDREIFPVYIAAYLEALGLSPDPVGVLTRPTKRPKFDGQTDQVRLKGPDVFGRNAEAGRAYGRPRARTPTTSVANATMRATPDTARVATNSHIDCSRTFRIAWLLGSTDVKASIASIVSVSRPDPSRWAVVALLAVARCCAISALLP
jgi:hypothetical protein